MPLCTARHPTSTTSNCSTARLPSLLVQSASSRPHGSTTRCRGRTAYNLQVRQHTDATTDNHPVTAPKQACAPGRGCNSLMSDMPANLTLNLTNQSTQPLHPTHHQHTAQQGMLLQATLMQARLHCTAAVPAQPRPVESQNDNLQNAADVTAQRSHTSQTISKPETPESTQHKAHGRTNSPKSDYHTWPSRHHIEGQVTATTSACHHITKGPAQLPH